MEQKKQKQNLKLSQNAFLKPLICNVSCLLKCLFLWYLGATVSGFDNLEFKKKKLFLK